MLAPCSDEIDGVRDGVLLARVAAPPIDGKANRALCRLFARELGVRPSDVSVVLGAASRDKLVQIEGISEDVVSAAIERAGDGGQVESSEPPW